MDVILLLFKTTTRLTLALTGLAVSAIVYLIHTLTGSLARRAQQNSATQALQRPEHVPTQPDSQPVMYPPQTPPAVHVHVHQTAPPHHPQPAPAQASQALSPHSVMSHPDHRIYITTGSHLMMEHPDSERLLEGLDHMLYVAAHRHGKPFSLNPPLDESTADNTSLHLLPLADLDEGVFFNSTCHPLPVPDGALWLRRAGQKPEKLEKGTA